MLDRLSKFSSAIPALTLAALFLAFVFNAGSFAAIDLRLIALLSPSDYIRGMIHALPFLLIYTMNALMEAVRLEVADDNKSGWQAMKKVEFIAPLIVNFIFLIVTVLYIPPLMMPMFLFFVCVLFVKVFVENNLLIREAMKVSILLFGTLMVLAYGFISTADKMYQLPDYVVEHNEEQRICRLLHVGSYGAICGEPGGRSTVYRDAQITAMRETEFQGPKTNYWPRRPLAEYLF